MNPAQEIQTRIAARIGKRQAPATAAEKATAAWSGEKAGKAHSFYPSTFAQNVIALAVADVKELEAKAGSALPSATNSTKEAGLWKSYLSGGKISFLASGTAKSIIAVAVADHRHLSAGIASKSAAVAASKARKLESGLLATQAEFNAMSPADKAEFSRLGGKVIGADKQAATTAPARPQPAKELTGLARTIAAFKSQSKK